MNNDFGYSRFTDFIDSIKGSYSDVEYSFMGHEFMEDDDINTYKDEEPSHDIKDPIDCEYTERYCDAEGMPNITISL